MKKFLLSFVVFIFFLYAYLLSAPRAVTASTQHSSVLLAQVIGTTPVSEGSWLTDSEVTFAGKNASRSATLFNWVLVNYKWSYMDNTLIEFWAKIRNVVFVLLIILVLISAFMMIITGGQSLTAMQFVRKFVLVIILITFSFALIRILYQIVDIIQSFFIKNPEGDIISSRDLLNISFNYADFVGYRKFGSAYNESAFVSLLLVKLTSATYFIMAGVLLIRKIILWFFITVSPIYPVLLLYFPIRNTAKIWIGEFFRWLLYAPLFAIFLSGLVVLWRNNISVLPFNFYAGGQKPVVFPTAINILLGGPGQRLAIDNNINYTDTFAEYIVALIMLWVVIFLPFLLLRIFLDYLSTVSFSNNSALKYFVSNAQKLLPNNEFFNGNPPTQAPKPPSPSYQPTGVARALPFLTGATKQVPQVAQVPQTTQVSQPVYQTTYNQYITNRPALKSERTSRETMQLVNFPIPTMRDVAKFETSRLSAATRSEVSRVHDTLQKIANPQTIANFTERQQFTTMREKLLQAQSKGEPLASSILNAANTVYRQTSGVTAFTQMNQQISQVHDTFQKLVNPQSITNVNEKQQFTTIKDTMQKASKQGDSYATTILSAATMISQIQNKQQALTQTQQTIDKIANPQVITSPTERGQFMALKEKLMQERLKGDLVAKSILTAADTLVQVKTAATPLPSVNQVQSVNLEDYEEVKKTWLDNYRKVEVPKTLDAPDRTRKQWIQDDLGKINSAISALTSNDPAKINEGMKEVGQLLPFLLIGGFSQSEVIAYLQAKKHAAEEVLSEVKEKETEEETLLTARKRETQTQATMHMQTAIPQGVPAFQSSVESEEEQPIYQVNQITNQYRQPALKSEASTKEVMNLVNLPVPTMQDVARYDSFKYSARLAEQSEMARIREFLEKLTFPQIIIQPAEKEHFIEVRNKLEQAKQRGDPLAISILLLVRLMGASDQPGTAQTQLVSTAILPEANKIQTVNLADYEEVRKMWKENYNNLKLPTDKQYKNRQEWIQNDMENIKKVLSLLSSNDKNKIAEGMKEVATILPFLLIGGFSLSEVIAYLEAKKRAAEDVLHDFSDKENEKETLLPVKDKTGQTTEMKMTEKLPQDVKPKEP